MHNAKNRAQQAKIVASEDIGQWYGYIEIEYEKERPKKHSICSNGSVKKNNKINRAGLAEFKKKKNGHVVFRTNFE